MSGQVGRFSAAIASENAKGCTAVIPDIKCRSPKEGDLLKGRNPVETAKYLVGCGAPVLSVVTEQADFGGSPDLLLSIAKSTGVPVLRKDFIKDTAMLHETVKCGASAVLLICAITDDENIKVLYETSLELGLEPLIEVCTVKEMEFACRLGARLIGINNRDILTGERDNGTPERTAALSALSPKGAVLISESGILSAEDAKLAVLSGADAVLVGTALWQASDMAEMYQTLRIKR